MTHGQFKVGLTAILWENLSFWGTPQAPQIPPEGGVNRENILSREMFSSFTEVQHIQGLRVIQGRELLKVVCDMNLKKEAIGSEDYVRNEAR